MHSAQLLADGFTRVRGLVHRVVDDTSVADLTFRVDDRANSIGWLVWHLTRIQDDHLADAMATEQVWLADGWHDRMALPFDPRSTGYGHTADDVAAVRVEADVLLGYHDAVSVRTLEQVGTLADEDLERVVDTNWDPPVTLGVRLVSVISDDLQHAGQAAFIRGIIERRPD
jgi:DinB family protein